MAYSIHSQGMGSSDPSHWLFISSIAARNKAYQKNSLTEVNADLPLTSLANWLRTVEVSLHKGRIWEEWVNPVELPKSVMEPIQPIVYVETQVKGHPPVLLKYKGNESRQVSSVCENYLSTLRYRSLDLPRPYPFESLTTMVRIYEFAVERVRCPHVLARFPHIKLMLPVDGSL